MIISRYLTREVMGALLTITTVLVVAFLSQQVVRYLNYAAIGKIPTDILLLLVSFEVPYLLALLLPLGLYLGILLAYGRLYADNEMAVLAMSGFGNRRLLRITACFALLVAGLILVLMLWVNPWVSTLRQQVMASDEAALHMIQTVIPGRFQASPDGRAVLYVGELSRDHGRAKNIFLAKESKKRGSGGQAVWTLVLADQGYQVEDADSNDPFFVTRNGYRYEGVPGQNDYKIIQFKKYAVRLPQANTRASHEEEETLSTSLLWHDYQTPKRAAELQWRFSIAISAFLLALLAVPLSALRPRQGRYLMLMPAVLVYILYINLLFIARHWLEQGRVPVYAGMWWVHLLILFAILFFSVFGARRGFKKSA